MEFYSSGRYTGSEDPFRGRRGNTLDSPIYRMMKTSAGTRTVTPSNPDRWNGETMFVVVDEEEVDSVVELIRRSADLLGCGYDCHREAHEGGFRIIFRARTRVSRPGRKAAGK